VQCSKPSMWFSPLISLDDQFLLDQACSCNSDCVNRISQRPRDVPLEIFKTQGKGWGVRASIDIVRGKVLGMYSG